MKEGIYELSKHFKLNTKQGLYPTNCGYNDFAKIEGILTPRIFDQYSFHMVIDGEGTFKISGSEYKLYKGDMFFLLRGESVCYYPSAKKPWKYFWMSFDGNEAPSLISDMDITPKTAVKKCLRLEEFSLMFKEILLKEHSLKEQFYLALSLIYSVASSFSYGGETQFIYGKNLISRIKDIISLNYKNPDISVAVIADITHVSHSYICKLFKKETGTTVIKYLVNYRLNKALDLLKQQDYLVKDLAYAVGFKDELHFMKEFKKHFGVTVKEYYKKHSN